MSGNVLRQTSSSMVQMTVELEENAVGFLQNDLFAS